MISSPSPLSLIKIKSNLEKSKSKSELEILLIRSVTIFALEIFGSEVWLFSHLRCFGSEVWLFSHLRFLNNLIKNIAKYRKLCGRIVQQNKLINSPGQFYTPLFRTIFEQHYSNEKYKEMSMNIKINNFTKNEHQIWKPTAPSRARGRRGR